MTKWLGAASAVVIVVAAAPGCGNSHGLYPVKGVVLSSGEPAVGATISFHPKPGTATQGQIPQGVVAEDGSFRLTSGDLGDGAAPGQYAVLVEWRQGPLRTHRLDATRSRSKGRAREGKALLIADDQLKGRYADIAHPRFEAEVKAETNQLPPWEIGK